MTEEQKAKQMLQWALQPDPTMDAEQGAAESGEIPGYEIEKILGQGGMGAVYKARHRELGRVVAIKVFSSTSEDAGMFVERLKKEGRMMAQLEHPNVLGIHDAAVTAEGVPYLILEYIDGMDLFVRMQNAETLSEKEAIRVATSVSKGLQAVHGLGIVHRDIKPANILLGNDGSIKVSDFGISKDVDDVAGTQLTLTGTTVGTVDYMSPEHSAGEELDARADIYSVGVMLYEMIAGVTPRGAFEPLSKFGASKKMEKLVMRCLQRDRNQRIGSAEELVEELAKVRAGLSKRGLPVWQQVGIGVLAGMAAVAALMAVIGNEDPSAGDGTAETEVGQDGKPEVMTLSPNAQEDLLDKSNWQDMRPMEGKFPPGENFRVEGNSLVSDGKGVNTLFSKLQPGDSYALEFKWKRYTGDHSIALFLPTPHGSVVFEMGAWGKNLMGIQGYKKGDRVVTMKEQAAKGVYQPNLPMYYAFKNGHYHYIRLVVKHGHLAVMMRPIDEHQYSQVALYDLRGKQWQIPSLWGKSKVKTIGFGSYHSAMYVSELKYRKF